MIPTMQGSNTLYFAYDASGVPMSVTYGNATYYYVTNVQGDVTGILNSSGALVVSYTYDAWGNQLSCTGDEAATLDTYNPLRYRGYILDQETGLYYLQSRYYDPEIGRFINADVLISTGQGTLSNNLYAYCLNNSINAVDPNGMCSYSVYMGGAVGAAGCYRCKNNRKYIDNQYDESVATKGFGMTTVGHAGCGPVAVYNATVTLGMNVTFDEVLDYYHSKTLSMPLMGLAGTSIDLISDFFEPKGYDVICAYNMDSIDAISPLADANILYYKFPASYGIIDAYGAHFAEYTYSGHAYYAHNVARDKRFSVPSKFAAKEARYDVVGIFIFEPLGG